MLIHFIRGPILKSTNSSGTNWILFSQSEEKLAYLRNWDNEYFNTSTFYFGRNPYHYNFLAQCRHLQSDSDVVQIK